MHIARKHKLKYLTRSIHFERNFSYVFSNMTLMRWLGWMDDWNSRAIMLQYLFLPAYFFPFFHSAFTSASDSSWALLLDIPFPFTILKHFFFLCFFSIYEYQPWIQCQPKYQSCMHIFRHNVNKQHSRFLGMFLLFAWMAYYVMAFTLLDEFMHV